jgi:PQQ-dependent catabolism-associated CXXCW motif protein
VSTRELVALMIGPKPPALIDVLDAPEDHVTLPTAWWWRGGGDHGKDNEAATAKLFGQMLATAVPSKDAPVVFFCESSRCWLSYNAALRAVAAGYTNVLWYRGGTLAWKSADLPRIKAALSGQFLIGAS